MTKRALAAACVCALACGVATTARAQSPALGDEALRRVLESGCRDGLPAVRELARDPNVTWAPTVARLCDDILRARAAATPPAVVPAPPAANDGRGRLVFWSSLYGVWLGIATDVLFDIKDSRAIIVPPLVGMGTGIAAALALTAQRPISAGQAWTIITGMDYGSVNGALWAGAFDASGKATAGIAASSGIGATAVAMLVADARHPSAGDIEVVRSGLLWGGAAGLLGALASGSDVSQRTVFAGGAAMMDVGFAAGLSLARAVDISHNRALTIDAGGVAGTVAGAAIVWLIEGESSHGRAIAASALGGMVAGLAIAALTTRQMDGDSDGQRASAPIPALYARDADGHWRAATPAPLPLFGVGGESARLVGAAVNAVGGVF